MYTNQKNNIGCAALSMLFVASAVLAQTSPDENLLRLLESVDSPSAIEDSGLSTPLVPEDVTPAPAEEVRMEVVAAEEVQMEVVATNEVVADEVVAAEVPAESVNSSDNDGALSRVLESVQSADKQAGGADREIDEIITLTVPEDEEEVVDDVGMESVADITASTFDDLISVRLDKVGLEDAINLFARLSGANIIVPELSESAQISVNLKEVEWRPALQAILDSYNYELHQRVAGSNVYSVRRRPEGAPVAQVVETFKLNFATVSDAAALIRQLLPTDAKVSEFASRNMIVVKSTESSLSEIRTVLQAIDTVRQQVYIESKFMELSDGAEKNLGIDWQMLGSYGAGVSVKQAGMGREDVSGSPSENLVTDMISDSTAAVAPLGNAEYAILTSVLDADDFQMVLSALEQNSGVNVVSNPKIIVANEELANISIITKEPNLKQNTTEKMNDTSDTITYEIDQTMPFFEYGIKLDVLPSINTSSNITVKINPSLTRKVRDKKDESPDSKDNGLLSYPVIDEKSIETEFSLSSGQTAAIGGLTEVSESEVQRKVPLLGSIPLLGRLFSWEQSVSGQNETIIFVTVGLANTQEIDSEIGLPEDSELARRRVILERNNKTKREQDRIYYQKLEDERLEDSLKSMKRQEDRRTELRMRTMLKQEAHARNDVQNDHKAVVMN